MDHIRKLSKEAFKYACWEDSAENRRQIDDIRKTAEQYIDQNPDIANQVEGAIRHGIHSRKLKVELEKKINQGVAEEEVAEWIAKDSDKSQFIHYDLKIALTKHIERQASRAKKYSGSSSSSYTPTIPYVKVDHIHPNSLRSLAPSERWHVVIDETGQYFNPSDVELLTPSDKQVGKVIALVIPDKVVLPTLKNNFHATDETDSALEKTISYILDNPDGILGFSSKHEAFTPHS